MDLDFTEEQQMLRDTVRGLCAEHSPIEIVRRMEDDPIGFPAPLWKQLGELGVTGLTLPEAYGGGGQSALEAMIVYEELGRALAPSPHFVSAILSAGAIAKGGTEAQKRTWLPKIAAGEVIVTPAWLEPRGGYGPAGIRLAASGSGGTLKLEGIKRHVLFAKAATRLLVLARSGSGAADVDLFLVDPGAPGVTLTQQHSVASDTQYEVAFRDVPVAAAERVGAAGGGWALWDEVMHDGIILLAAQAMGGVERALEITVDYAKTRHQFDKPLGAFQAIAHYLADATTLVDGGTHPRARGGVGTRDRTSDRQVGSDGEALRVPHVSRRDGDGAAGARRHRVHPRVRHPAVLPPREAAPVVVLGRSPPRGARRDGRARGTERRAALARTLHESSPASADRTSSRAGLAPHSST